MNAHRLVTVPLHLIGAGTILLGLGWLFAPEPWLLDQRANEVLLRVSYTDLLAAPVNTHLDDYLTGLYRFFGWWIVAIGLLVVVYVAATGLVSRRQRVAIHLAMAVIVGGLYVLQRRFIPGSPFVWASYGLAALVVLSAAAARRLPQGSALAGRG